MTVGHLEELLSAIKDKDMPVMFDIGEGVIISVCGENSQVVELPFLEDEDVENFENSNPITEFYEYDLGDENDINEDDLKTIEILLLVPCNHACEIEEGAVNSQPELN